MSDPTTDGLAATPAEIEGMVRNLCAYALGEPDPIQRYESLTHQQVLFQGIVDALRRERGKMVADLVVAGLSVTDVAAQTSLGTVVKVRKLISLAGETQRLREATAARNEAERKTVNGEKAAPAETTPPAATTETAPIEQTEAAQTAALASEARPAEARPAEAAGTAEARPAEARPAEAAGTAEARPAEARPAEAAGTVGVAGASERERTATAPAKAAPTGSFSEQLPPHLAAPKGRRMLTQADLVALGLPVDLSYRHA